MSELLRYRSNDEAQANSEWDKLAETNTGDNTATNAEVQDQWMADSQGGYTPTEAARAREEHTQDLARMQEVFERSLNDSLISLGELEHIMEGGAEGASKRIIEYHGKQIAVYNAGELNFPFIKHSIQYSGAEKTLSSQLVNDPSFWLTSEKKAREAIPGSATMLSTIYVDSSSYYGSSNDGISYGVLHVLSESLARIAVNSSGESRNRTRESANVGDLQRTYLNESSLPESLLSDPPRFTEIQFFRYDEDGNVAFRPDFIQAPTTGINEATLRHAAFFDVPIIQIPSQEQKSVKAEADHLSASISETIQRYLEINPKKLSADELSKEESLLRTAVKDPDDPFWETGINSKMFANLKKKVNERYTIEAQLSKVFVDRVTTETDVVSFTELQDIQTSIGEPDIEKALARLKARRQTLLDRINSFISENQEYEDQLRRIVESGSDSSHILSGPAARNFLGDVKQLRIVEEQLNNLSKTT